MKRRMKRVWVDGPPEFIPEAIAILRRIGISATAHPIIACKLCGHFSCVCSIKAEHEESCKYRIAAAGAVAIECKHGFDCCSKCDPLLANTQLPYRLV